MRILGRAAVSLALTAAAAITAASPALAHVTVFSVDAKQGGYGVLTFRVPTESDTASTVELRVSLPVDRPMFWVATQPKPGWTATVTKKNLLGPTTDKRGKVHTQYVSQVIWRADNPAAGIPPNQFDMFNITGGPLPDEASLALPAEQFYSDGHSVNFNETPTAGQPTPENPTPVLKLASTDPTTGAPAWPGIAGLIVGGIALMIALADLFLLRRRNPVQR